MQDESIIVVGAGIAGLSFSIRALSLGFKRIVVLERGDENRVQQYSHSISIRRDIGGVQALEKLGDVTTLPTTPTQGFYMATMSGLVLTTDWFVSDNLRGLRLLRIDLWLFLLKRARELGCEIKFNQHVTAVTESAEGVSVLTEAGETYNGKFLVAADGSKSVLRQNLVPSQKLNFLDLVIVGDHEALKDLPPCPDYVRNHHGITVAPLSSKGQASSLFLAEESEGSMLVSIAFRNYEPVSREILQENPDFKTRLLEIADRVPDGFFREVVESINPKTAFAVSAHDLMPWKQEFSRVAFIGDSWHPVSPMAGAGANMAIVDGVLLAETLAKVSSFKEAASSLSTQNREKWSAVVQQQRRTIDLLHTSSFFGRLGRGVALNAIHWIAHPVKRRIVAGVVLASVVAGAAYLFRRYWG